MMLLDGFIRTTANVPASSEAVEAIIVMPEFVVTVRVL